MWQKKNSSLYRKFEFKNFNQTFAFMQSVAETANNLDHHPRWCNNYNKVEIWLNTHSTGGIITDKDYNLAKAIDKIYQNHVSQKP
jgi:4a-hydroxytetrahydrobiopterin dehydratase